jgi:hypothetical protein
MYFIAKLIGSNISSQSGVKLVVQLRKHRVMWTKFENALLQGVL